MRSRLATVVMTVVAVAVTATAAFAQGNGDDTKAADNRVSDVAVGYTFMHDSDLNFPLGISLSQAARVQKHVDIVVNEAYSHASVTGLDSIGIFSVLGGVRFNGGNGGPARSFAEVTAGVAKAGISVLGTQVATATGFAVQPSGGIEVGLTKTIGIRPQIDYLFLHNDGGWNSDIRFGVSAVFRFTN